MQQFTAKVVSIAPGRSHVPQDVWINHAVCACSELMTPVLPHGIQVAGVTRASSAGMLGPTTAACSYVSHEKVRFGLSDAIGQFQSCVTVLMSVVL